MSEVSSSFLVYYSSSKPVNKAKRVVTRRRERGLGAFLESKEGVFSLMCIFLKGNYKAYVNLPIVDLFHGEMMSPAPYYVLIYVIGWTKDSTNLQRIYHLTTHMSLCSLIAILRRESIGEDLTYNLMVPVCHSQNALYTIYMKKTVSLVFHLVHVWYNNESYKYHDSIAIFFNFFITIIFLLFIYYYYLGFFLVFVAFQENQK